MKGPGGSFVACVREREGGREGEREGEEERGREGGREEDRMRTQYDGDLWGIQYDVVDVSDRKSKTTTVTVCITIFCFVSRKLFFQFARHRREEYQGQKPNLLNNTGK